MATILIVDDEQLICDLLRSVLGRQGHEIITASNGREGLELFKKHKPRFTLLDLRMPEMNGVEVLKHIRAIDPKAAVMILTAWGSDALERQARQLGVMDFLSKGLALDVLVSAMERALPKVVKIPAVAPLTTPVPDMAVPASSVAPAVPLPTPPLPVPPSEAAPPAMDSILVVDDEPPICELMQRFLSLRGYRVRTAHGGHQALAAVDQEAPKLLVLDMTMPEMNGVEVLRKLRDRQYAGGVILLTTGQDDRLLEEALDLGSVDVMGKPVDLERLALAIQIGSVLSEQQRGWSG